MLPLLVLSGLLATSLHAGTWTVQPWTGDASTGIINGETQWAYHFGSATAATVNGVSVPGFAGPPPVNVAGQFDLTGAQFVLNPDPNNLTSLGGTSSAIMGGSFFYGGLPSTNLTVKAASLQAGGQYVVSFYSVGWDGPTDPRLIKFVSGTDEMAIDQNLYGENFGLRADYAFTAGAGDQALRVDMNNAFNRTFHVYAVALRKVAIQTNVTLTSSANPAVPGASVTFTATVTPVSGGGTPTGNVVFKDGATTLNTATLNAGGVATYTTSALSEASHDITATYVGSTTYHRKVSPTLTQVVSKINTNVSLGSSANPVLPGTPVTFTATVTPLTSGSTPTGIVTFFDGGTPIGGPLALDGAGSAAFTTSALTAGLHNITASYGGNTIYNTSVSGLLPQSIAGTYTVTTTAAAGAGSLAQILTDASPGSFVVFHASLAGQSVQMPASEIILDKDVTIDAAALTGGIILQGGGTNRLFYIQAGKTAIFKGLTLTGGGGAGAANTLRGGAVLSAGTLTLEDCVLRGNTASLGGALASGYSTQNTSLTVRRCRFIGNSAAAGYGGALMNLCLNSTTAQALVEDSTFTGNTASGAGAAIYNSGNTGTSSLQLRTSTIQGNSNSSPLIGGSVLNYSNNVTGTANMTVDQCTITGNTAAASGGGLLNAAYDTTAGSPTGPASLTITHCTVVGNAARSGGGLFSQGAPAVTTVTSSIIAGNTSVQDGRDVRLVSGTVTSQGGNLIGSTTDSQITWQGTDLTGTDAAPLNPKLAPIGSYGGLTATMPPASGSPALDSAPTPVFPTDQRGLPRVVDGDQNGTASADIGAAESSFMRVDVATDELDVPAGAGDVSLREALRDAPDGAIITFAPGLSGTTLNLAAGLGSLQPTKSVLVDATSLPGGFTIRREPGGPRLFQVGAGVGLSLKNLFLTGAVTTLADAGGAIFNLGGSVSLEKCIITGHNSSAGGGAMYLSSGSLEISQCTISGNTSGTLLGGAIGVGSGTLTLKDSTLLENGTGGKGSALFMTGGTAMVSQCTFEGNAAGAVKLRPVDISNIPVLSLTHCTITRNASLDGGGGLLIAGATAPVISLHNTLIAGNTGSLGCPDISNLDNAPITRSGTNIIGKNDGAEAVFAPGLPNAAGDYVGTGAAPVDPLLGALASNGGATFTCLPLAGSPAIDHASGTIPTSDQRGLSRPRDGNGDNTFVADIGAVEIGPPGVYQVTTLADELDTPPGASLSLREAVRDAPAGAVITFAPALSGKTLILDSVKGEIAPTRAVIIDASALPDGLILDGGPGTNRHFFVTATAGSFELRHLTLTGGGGTGTSNSGFGGAFLSIVPTTLVDCTFRGNQSTNRGGAVVVASATAQFTRCTFHDNLSSANLGGALYLQTSVAVLDHCTLTRNHSGGGDGGAIFTSQGTYLTLTHCTIAGNTSSDSNGGISVFGQAGDRLTLTSTVLAGNLGQDLRLYNVFPTPGSGGGNVLGLDDFFVNYNQPTDTRNVTASQLNLAELGRYGGLTDTMPPMPGSPALDRATSSTATADQRGFARNFDGDFNGSAVSDSGAAESFIVRTNSFNDEFNTPSGTSVSLREAIRDAPVGAVVTSTVNGSSVFREELVLDKPLILAGNAVTWSIAPTSLRVFYVAPGAQVHMHRISIPGTGPSFGGTGTGAVASGKGGTILNQGVLSMTHCTLEFGKADYGGAIANGMAPTPSTLVMRRCNLGANSATAYGGALYNASASGGAATVILENCRIYSNTSGRHGGALVNTAGNGLASMTLLHCTVVGNSAVASGGGLHTFSTGTSTTAVTTTLTSSIIAGNTAPQGPDVQLNSGAVSSLTNLIGVADSGGGGLLTGGTNLTGTLAAPLSPGLLFHPPRVNSLQPLLGSPVIDAADPAAASTLVVDNLRQIRVVDGDLNGTALPDIGAVEAVAVKVTTAADELDTPAGANVSLREAIRDTTASSAIIRLDPALSGQTLTLDAAKGQITAGNNLLLDASALPAGFTIDAGSGANRIFQTSGTVRLAGLTLQGGEAGSDGGGAILMTGGSLTLERCVVRGNTTTGSGGALNVTGGTLLTLNQCSFSGNSCTGGSSLGGAVNSLASNIRFVMTESSFTSNTANVSGGAILLETSRDPANLIRQCTVAGNRAAGSGGGIRIVNATATVQQCTITGNEGVNGSGGGLQGTSNSTMSMLNCVVAGNRAPTGPDLASLDSTVTTRSGANVIGQNKDVSTLFPAPAVPGAANANGDYVGTAAAPLDALLAPAGNYGGPALVQTCPPMPGSPALDRAVGTSLTTDARGAGFSRVVDGDSDGTARADIGAAEAVMVRVDVANDELDVPAGVNDVSLREAVRDAPEGAVISFAPALSGQTLTLTAGELFPSRSVILNGSGLAALVNLTATSGSRILNISSGVSVGLSHLRLRDCSLAGSGAAILNAGMLGLADCEFINNTAVTSGGAIRHAPGSGSSHLRAERCLFSGNVSSASDGGAIDGVSDLAQNPVRLLLEDCRFTGNTALALGGAVECSSNGGASMTLKVLRSTFTSNTGYRGGGLYVATGGAGSVGTVSVDACTFYDNKAPGYSGGGLGVGAFGGGKLTTVVSQCTFAQNSSGPVSGGAVMNDGFDPGSSSLLTLRRCTLAGNTTTHAQGGGTSIDGYNSGSATTVLDGCLIAGNTSASTAMDVGRFNGAVVTSLGNNLIGNITGTSNVTWLGTDLTGTAAVPLNPMLASLGDYGGPTQTMPPLPGSPARNPVGGTSAAIVGMLRDQRGGVRLQGETMDIGSVETTAEDAPGTIAFGAPVVRVQEGTTALVPVYRTAGTIGTVTVSYASQSAGLGTGFATPPEDYTAVSGTLTFAPGDTVKTISITAATDAPTLKEPHESFTLTLSNVTGGASPGAQSSTTVRILDSVDAAVPTLVLTTPKANAIFLEANGTGVSVTGSAKDDKGVQAVQVQLNGGAFVDAVLAPSTTSTMPTFALTVTAVPGVNTLVVRSVDEKGKISALQKRSFTYRVIRPLITSVSGGEAGVVGTITRPAAVDKTVPNSLYVGMTYKVTATPKPGYLFGGWYYSFPTPPPGMPRLTLADIGLTAASLELPALSFIMQPGLTLTANFSPNVQPDTIGIYTGLILPSSTKPAPGGTSAKNDTTGLFTATLASTGAFSGTLKIDGASLPFAGTTNTAGEQSRPGE
ncbi:choice-of-anchor Q domain-containing protein [Brevifollis gellanilyticus]|uniref:choice-of-anchor Q domain-containing protein n=1 Tax=Brevifollis gellanilyticus TaxID=748831 RepID=UPI001479419F|nr:choice-of-anchor Q domain-containing protein [Brevifollis gellanilyticus]